MNRHKQWVGVLRTTYYYNGIVGSSRVDSTVSPSPAFGGGRRG